MQRRPYQLIVGGLYTARVPDAFSYIDANLDRFVDELCQLVRIPSFGANTTAMPKAAAFLCRLMRAKGIETDLVAVPGAHQYVVGQAISQERRSVLWFNHYDIADYTNPVPWPPAPGQPDSFSGAVRDGRIYGRGVADDKATLLSRVHAFEALQAAYPALPLTVRFLFEGKQSVDSPALGVFLERYHERVRSDFCFWEAGSKDEEDRPQLTLGHKGYLYLDVALRALSQPMPSRVTVLPNAANRLIWALASLKDPHEHVLIDGFYDAVRPVSPAEEETIFRNLSANNDDLLRRSGARAFVRNLEGRDVTRWLYTEPSLAVCGIESGHTGRGQKLLAPDEARAKVEIRLVPDQDPEDVLAKLRRHLDGQGFDDVELVVLGRAQPYKVELSEPIVDIAHRAALRVYGMEPVITPVATGMGHRFHFRKWMDMPIAGFAVGYAGSRLETSDEHIRVADYEQGIKYAVAVMEEAAASDGGS